MTRLALLFGILMLATPAHAQHAGHSPPPAAAQQPQAVPPADPGCAPEHAAMGHCTPRPAAPAPDPSCPPEHAAMGHCTPKASAGEPAPPAAPPPPPAPPPPAALGGPDHAADSLYGAQAMAEARAVLRKEHGAILVRQILIDQLETGFHKGRQSYAWDAQGWVGGDIDRLWLKSEGEGFHGERPEQVEVQALFSRAIDPWFNVQAGVRQDFASGPDRTHLVLGIQGLARYWFETDAALFLSAQGELTGRLQAEYDQRLTQRLILQPHIEFNLAAQDVPELGIGAGLRSTELGLRLRYQFVPEFAPYIGVRYEHAFGRTADFARARGEEAAGVAFLIGVRAWF